MVRRLTVVVGLAMSLLVAREVSACPVTPADLVVTPADLVATPVDLDAIVLGDSIVPSLADVFKWASRHHRRWARS